MLNKIVRSPLKVIPFINPFILEEINSLGMFCGINDAVKREQQIVVSISSEKKQYKELPVTIFSLLNQSLKPDKIILWIDKETDDLTTLPYEITRFIKNGLEIRFVKNLKSFTKTIYAFKEFKKSIIVTAEPNIYYRKDWLKRLYYSYVAAPENIHAHIVNKVIIKDGTILPYHNWNKKITEENAGFDNYMISEGGILYPPQCFNSEAFREDIFLNNVNISDNMWFWFMALVNNKKIRVVKNHYSTILCVNIFKNTHNCNLFTPKHYKDKDIQIEYLMKYYGQNILNKLR